MEREREAIGAMAHGRGHSPTKRVSPPWQASGWEGARGGEPVGRGEEDVGGNNAAESGERGGGGAVRGKGNVR